MIFVRPCGISIARVGVARLHRHLPHPPPSALVAFELLRDGWPVGWALVGRPASRVLDAEGWVDVTRVAVPPVGEGGPPSGCSALYGACARWARRARLPLLTYTRVDEPGTSLRGAGWVAVALTATRPGGRAWTREGRSRRSVESERIGKVRWCPRWSFVGPEIPPEWVGSAPRETA